MATLTNTKIKDTYKSLLKVSDNGNLEAGLQEITDGEGNASGVQLNTGGDFTASGTISFGSLKDTGENITIAKFVDAADGIGSNNNDTSLPTSAAVATYVAAQITAEDLDFAGGSGTGSVDLDSQTFTIAGTTNEIETSASGQTLTIGLPSDVIIGNDLTVTTDASVGNDLGVTGALTAGTAQINGLLDVVGEVQATFLDINGNGELSGNFAVDTDTLFVDATNDRVGVNKTNPAVALDVTGDAAVSGNLTVDTNTLYVDAANNRVGIGTSSPNAEIQVVKSANSRLRLETDDSGNSSIQFADATSPNVGQIQYKHSEDAMLFQANGSERMRITSAGNVGIGSSSPISKLTLEGAKNTNTLTLRSTTNDSNWVSGDKLGSIDFYSNDGSGGGQGVKGSISYINALGTSGTTNAMIFSTASTTVNNIERMRIDADGNIGVGTSSPDTKLTVQGGIKIFDGSLTDSLTISSSTTSTYAATITQGDLGIQFNTSSAVRGYTFSINSAEKIRIDNNGLKFNGDTAAANALDDYEEGTWSPEYIPTTGSFATMTMEVLNASYTKIGNVVNITAQIRTDDVDVTGGSGNVLIGGLPYTAVLSSGGGGAISVGFTGGFVNAPTNGGFTNNGTTIVLRVGTTPMAVADLTDGTSANENTLYFAASYFTS